MATEAQRLQTITNNIESTYQSMRKAAAQIAGLLQLGRATCEVVKAYNLWALATYNAQRGMLATMRSAGETGVPELPPAPTLFVWRGVQGAEAWKINCANEPQTLKGAMKKALKGPTAATAYLSTNEIEISTQDPYLMDPEASPSFKTLWAVQAQQSPQAMAGLGIGPGVIIVIAAIAIVATAAIITAVMHYLEVNEIQEAQTEQTALQARAYANYTEAMLACYATCTKEGKPTETCVPMCNKLIAKPNFTFPGAATKWGTLQWIGFTVVAGVGTMIAWRVYTRHREGRPIFQLPEMPT